MLAADLLAELLEPLDALAHAVQGLAPEQLHVRFGGRDPFGRFGSAPKYSFGWVRSPRTTGRSSSAESVTEKCSPA
nr:hypothetical protein GCM10025732_04330 [Glycomyces mayteni]